MPYTLAKGFVWVLLALLLGFVIGWVLRSITARRQVARARAHHVETAELERLRRRAADLESAAAERERQPLDTVTSAGPSGEGMIGVPDEPDEPDGERLPEAEAAIGRPVRRDDLKVIVGIGPNVEELCSGIGIATWGELAETEVSLLATMLEDAGARFRSSDPSTWPIQAELLATGQWSEFAALASGLDQSGK